MDAAGAAASAGTQPSPADRKSTRLNSSHANISYAVFCLKKKQEPLSLETGFPPRFLPPIHTHHAHPDPPAARAAPQLRVHLAIGVVTPDPLPTPTLHCIH